MCHFLDTTADTTVDTTNDTVLNSENHGKWPKTVKITEMAENRENTVKHGKQW